MRTFRLSLYSLFLIGFLSINYVSAQIKSERCGTMPMYEQHLKKNWRKQNLQSFETWMAKKISQRSTQRTQATVYTIPVIVHIVHPGDELGDASNISKEQVLSQITVMNEDFRRTNSDASNTPSAFSSVAADTEIQFELAVLDTSGNKLEEPGIHRYKDDSRQGWTMSDIESTLKPATSWNPSKYLNIWVVPFPAGSSTLGYAQFPEQSGLDGITTDPTTDKPETDGVVINTKFFGSNYTDAGSSFNLVTNFDRGRTATHEVGHWLGLRHIWGDGGCSVDDYCADTPAAGGNNDGLGDCTYPGPNSCTSDEFHDMFQNYMDYTNDACMNLFTNDQKTRMRTVLESSPRRKEVVTNAQLVLAVNTPLAALSSSNVYPNPMQGNAKVSLENKLTGNIEVIITDLTGKVLQQQTSKKLGESWSQIIATGELSAGVYIITLKMKEGSISKRLVKQ